MSIKALMPISANTTAHGDVRDDAGRASAEAFQQRPVDVATADPHVRVADVAERRGELEAEGKALARLQRVNLQEPVGAVVHGRELVLVRIDRAARSLVPVLHLRAVGFLHGCVRVDLRVARLEAQREAAHARTASWVE